MTFVDPVGDMITRIRNAQLRALYNVKIPSSKFRAKILEVLKQEGYISNYKLLSDSKNKKLPLDERFNAQLKLAKLPRNSAKIRIRNRCEITGRPRAVYRKLRISRIALRELASKGIIPGMTKSSW